MSATAVRHLSLEECYHAACAVCGADIAREKGRKYAGRTVPETTGRHLYAHMTAREGFSTAESARYINTGHSTIIDLRAKCPDLDLLAIAERVADELNRKNRHIRRLLDAARSAH